MPNPVSLKPMPISQWNCPWAETAQAWLEGVTWSVGDSASRAPHGNCAGNRDIQGPWLGVISSHLGRESWRDPWWQRVLEDALRYARESRSVVLYSGQAPYSDAIRHACERLGIPHEELGVFRARETIRTPEHSVRLHRIPRDGAEGESSSLDDASLCDAAVAILSHRLFAIQVRPKGKVSQWLQRRLSEPSVALGTTWVASVPDPTQSQRATQTQRALHKQLNAQGAVLWLRSELDTTAALGRVDASDSIDRVLGCARRTVPATLQPIGSFSRWRGRDEDYLIHCTRARRGPWPDQDYEGYLDEALRLETRKVSTPFATLHRIVMTQRLVATRWMRRGDLDTVCFSGVPLLELLQRRRFQSHLGRWDWEPYGIAIRRSWLEQRGARPVEYLNRSEFDQCPSERIAFAQPIGQAAGAFDWTQEREWRVAHDVRLQDLGIGDGFLFVANKAEAACLAHDAKLPVLYGFGDEDDEVGEYGVREYDVRHQSVREPDDILWHEVVLDAMDGTRSPWKGDLLSDQGRPVGGEERDMEL
jgi:hypothetical protein